MTRYIKKIKILILNVGNVYKYIKYKNKQAELSASLGSVLAGASVLTDTTILYIICVACYFVLQI